ncbi:MAG: flagellar motor switch protein FliM [Alphaproteobacteria bacterium]
MAEEKVPTATPDEGDKLAAQWAAMAGDGGAGDDAGDALAAEWAAMASDGDAPVDSTRVLNQDEIDSLLGFGAAEEENGSPRGIAAILNSSLVSYERLPMLEVVFDRMVRVLSTSLRNFTSDNVDVTLDGLSSLRFGTYLNSIPLPAIIAVFKAEEWEGYGVVTVDSALVYAVVDVLLGGRRGAASMRIEGRPYTTIERNLVERLVQVILTDLAASFEPLHKVTFTLERLETNPRFASITRPANAAILARLTVDMVDRGGQIEILLPYATLEPIRELLLQMFVGEKFGQDAIWENHLATVLWSTEIEIEAVLDELVVSLHDVAALSVGKTFLLNAVPDSPVRLRSGGVVMGSGEIGRASGNVAIRLDAPLRCAWNAR